MADELFLTLATKRNPVIKRYTDVLANDTMGRYRAIVQWSSKGDSSGKAGQTYYEHALHGVFTLERLRDPLLGLNLTEPETCCLFAAYTVHDLNKIPPYSTLKASYATLATDEHFAEELRRLKIEAFFPEWEHHLPDIAALARLHQGHLAVTAEGLDRTTANRLALGRRRVEQLGHLMRAADVIDLSQTLDLDETHKHTFLHELNAALDEGRWRFITHQLGEQRGLLSNLIHNAVVTTMRERFGAIDLLYYADGVAYLVPDGTPFDWDEAALAATAQVVERRLAAIQGESLSSFVKGSNTGIQVDAAALESGVGWAAILAQLRSVVEGGGGTYSAKSVLKREEDVRANDLRPAVTTATDPEQRTILETLLAEEIILPRGEEQLRRAYLVDGYRNLLSRHLEAVLKRRKHDAWSHLYAVLALPEASHHVYNTISAGRRAYFLARDLHAGFEDLYELLLQDLLTLTGEAGQTQDRSLLLSYLRLHLNVQGAHTPGRDFRAPLRRYIQDQHRQCCYCGNSEPTGDWMSANAPPSLNVQLFSARLEGGSNGDPKRMICGICRAQFILEKLTWAPHRDKRGAEQATYYLHLFPRTFLTEPLLAAFAGGLERLHAEETGAFFLDTNGFFRDRLAGDGAVGWGQLKVKTHKVNGIALPKLHEAIGNVPVLALNAPGKTNDAQFLLALEKALVLQRFFPSRVVLTRSPVPPLIPHATQTLVLDGVPRTMSWLLPTTELDEPAIERLLECLTALHAVGRQLYQPRTNETPVLDLIAAANDDPLALYYIADRLIERKVSGPDADRRAHGLMRAIAPQLKLLAGSQAGRSKGGRAP